ncbi:abortive infection family protein [Fructobacillus cardui]|uniref:abortive infection family protein n=1 Tax=Fructobacillus cardui TaxID=2893170 RepID=UPI002D97B64C|nr:hypothetical protein R53653_IHELHDKM_00739 [Fructobacillus cardui]
MQTDFQALQQKDIIEIMIDGEIVSYMSAADIENLSNKFSYKPLATKNQMKQSRWKIMEELLKNLNRDNKTSDFLHYILSSTFLKPKINERITNFTFLNENDQSTIIDEIRLNIVNDFLKAINEQLIYSKQSIVYKNGGFFITHTQYASTLPEQTIYETDNYSINELVVRAKNSLQSNDYESVVTKSRTILENTFLQIIHENGRTIKEDGKIFKYQQAVQEILNMRPKKDWNDHIKKIIGSIHTIVDSVSQLRNDGGSDAHASTRKFKVPYAEAELILNSAITISTYYLKINERHKD